MRFAPFVLVAPFALVASAAQAQPLPFSIDASTWRPSTDPSGGLVLEPTTTLGAGNWSFGAFFNYAYRPVSVSLSQATPGTLSTAGTPSTVSLHPVEDLLGVHLAGSVGIGRRFALGASLPLVLYETGDKNMPATVSTTGQVPATGLGDLALTGKGTIIDNAQGGFGLAALATLTVPTGSTDNFTGDDAFTIGGRLVADYTLLVASVQASLGYVVRPDQRTWPAASAGGVTFGNTIPWSFVVAVKPAAFNWDKDHRQRWELGVHGWVPGGPVAPFVGTGAALESPALLSAADRIELGHYRDGFVLAGAEVGLDNAIGTPIVRGILGIGWAPRNHDMDSDGVPDDVDQCPELAEDRDGFEDDDGCPEIDNDDDGILDKDDAGPNVAGQPSTDPAKNGCPQPDRDKDGVPDDVDACPDEKGVQTDDPKTNGCPRGGDRDKDGIGDRADKCPDQPEDKDGFEDEDGCPDPDNDGDGIADTQDACPMEPGVASSDPKLNGCPNPDRDGDTFDNAADTCPDEPENFNGVEDDDGCPDKGGKPLVTIVEGPNHAPRLKVAPGDKLAPDGNTVRAIVVEMNQHKAWTLLVASEPPKHPAPATNAAPLEDRAIVLVRAFDALAHREIAEHPPGDEQVGWNVLAKEPLTAPGIKVVILVGGTKEPAPAPLPPAPKP